MSSLIAIDPGTRSTGIAKFLNGQLVQAYTLKSYSKDINTRMRAIVEDHGRSGHFADRVVLEIPHVHGRKVDPNKALIPLAIIGGALWARSSIYSEPPELIMATASQWKGSLGKPTCHARGRMRLKIDEISIWAKSASDDERDAICLGLWAVGRFGPQRVIAR